MAEVRLREGETLEDALRRFKRKVSEEGIIQEVKRHAFYLKPDQRRRPGQFVDTALTLGTQQNVVVVPAEALQPGLRGQMVYVVKPDQTVETRVVTVGPSELACGFIMCQVQRMFDAEAAAGGAPRPSGMRVHRDTTGTCMAADLPGTQSTRAEVPGLPGAGSG